MTKTKMRVKETVTKRRDILKTAFGAVKEAVLREVEVKWSRYISEEKG